MLRHFDDAGFSRFGFRQFSAVYVVLCQEFLILVAFSARLQRSDRGEAALPLCQAPKSHSVLLATAPRTSVEPQQTFEFHHFPLSLALAVLRK